jgi:hypothetical protein
MKTFLLTTFFAFALLVSKANMLEESKKSSGRCDSFFGEGIMSISQTFFPSFPLAEGRVVQRSVDRVGKYAGDINANALAQMHGGLTHPADASLGDPLCFAKRVKKENGRESHGARRLILVSKAQNSNKMENKQQDSLAITQALENYYFKGIYEGNISTLGNIFHPGTLLFGDVKGQPYAKTLEQYLDGVANRQSPKDSGKPFKGTIISIDVVNSIAVAKVQVKMYDFNYNEFLSFHKIDNRWLIVNKMISDVAE